MVHTDPYHHANTSPVHTSKQRLFLGSKRRWLYLLAGFLLLANIPSHAQSLPLADTPQLSTVLEWPYHIERHASHSPELFTQGIIVGADSVIESSGLYRRSFVTKYNRESGTTEAHFTLPKKMFAEGIALYGQQLYLLTWKSGKGFVLNAHNLQPIREFHFKGEGWGLTRIGQQLVMSNGSAELTWHRPSDFKLLNKTIVRAGPKPVGNLNALAYGGGYLWANVWRQATILAISPATGQVEGRLQLDDLWQQQGRGNRENVLNGLSWDESEQALWVTGKRWQQRYLLRITRPETAVQSNAIK